jgi:selenocysteine lyase/cysteine desulfurase
MPTTAAALAETAMCAPDAVVFTAGRADGLRTALRLLLPPSPSAAGDELLTTRFEHRAVNAVLQEWEQPQPVSV